MAKFSRYRTQLPDPGTRTALDVSKMKDENKKKEILTKYLPASSVEEVLELLDQYPCFIKITRSRVTKHGDFRRYADGRIQISINNDPNAYRFLITLIHELAHLVTFKEKKGVRPHGREWQITFQRLMLPLLRPEVFPERILSCLAGYLKKPKASTDGDIDLSLALREFDPENDKSLVAELPSESLFVYRDRTFVKGEKRRTRFECIELATHKKYIFHPHAEVRPLNNNYD